MFLLCLSWLCGHVPSGTKLLLTQNYSEILLFEKYEFHASFLQKVLFPVDFEVRNPSSFLGKYSLISFVSYGSYRGHRPLKDVHFSIAGSLLAASHPARVPGWRDGQENRRYIWLFAQKPFESPNRPKPPQAPKILENLVLPRNPQEFH